MSYKVDHIPRTTPNNRRPGHAMTATTITIHNTANPTSTARNERNWLTNPSNSGTASYHIVIDERETIECLPLSEVAWHAGDGGSGPGNRTSIAIEICESGNYALTLERAAELVADMLRARGWGVDRLRRHWDWPRPSDGYRKNCPRLMNADGKWGGWIEFVEKVKKAMKPTEPKPIQPPQQQPIPGITPFRDVEAGRWSEGAIKMAADAGLMSGYPDGSFKPAQAVTREELAAVLTRLHQ